MLKNGNRIVADSVKESAGRVEYTIGENTFAVPKSAVLRVETGPGPVASGSSAGSTEPPPAIHPGPVIDGTAGLRARIVHDNQLDEAALSAVEAEGNAQKSAAAYSIAADFSQKHSNLEAASRYLRTALGYLPDNPVLQEDYASVLLQLGQNSDALPYAERASKAIPPSAEAFLLLGYAYYKNDRNTDAIAAWKTSLKIRPDPEVQAWLDRAERESKAEADFRQQESDHFVLSYEGSRTPDGLRQQIMDTLESEYSDLQRDLGASPRNIHVSLYSDEKFFDVTQAPSWSAALNDGKIRIPISGLTGMTPDLAHMLRHELTHSFIAQIVHGRAPQWLNEGIAQLEQGLTTAPVARNITALYTSGRQIPLNQLEGDFTQYSPSEALVAYAEALAATEYIRNRYGMDALARILEKIGEGQSAESALRATIHSGYAQLESEIAEYLKRQYGS